MPAFDPRRTESTGRGGAYARLASLHIRATPRRDVVLALIVKGVLLLAIYCAFFGPAHHPRSDAAATAAAFIGESMRKESR